MGKIIIAHSVVLYLEDLMFILFKKEYFGFEEDAQLYVSKIYDFIENGLVSFQPRTSPVQLKRFGKNYVLYNANNHTTWYIFFEERAGNYLVTYITNNHSEEARYL